MLELNKQKIQDILKEDFEYLKCINKQDPSIFVLNVRINYRINERIDECLNYISDMGFDIVDQLQYIDLDGTNRKLYIFKEL